MSTLIEEIFELSRSNFAFAAALDYIRIYQPSYWALKIECSFIRNCKSYWEMFMMACIYISETGKHLLISRDRPSSSSGTGELRSGLIEYRGTIDLVVVF